jgi:hypothetical protein
VIVIADVTISQVIEYADKIGLVAVLFLILVGGKKGWWVFGWHYEEQVERTNLVREEKDAWRETALIASNVATDAFRVLRKKP